MKISTLLFVFLTFTVFSYSQEEVFGAEEKIISSLEGKIYKLEEGTGALPNFDTIEPVGRIYATELNVSPRSFSSGFPGVTDIYEWFGIEFKGNIRVKEAGDYHFRLLSDDGSKLFINDSLIINNDGVHGAYSSTGSIYLDESKHKIKVQYFQGPRHHIALQLFYTFKEVEQIFPGEIDITIPKANKNKWLWILIILILLGGGMLVQDRLKKKKKPKDDTCDFLYAVNDKGKSIALLPWVKKLRKYKPWVRQLVCQYLKSNFNNIKEREAFVQNAILAYKTNGQPVWSVLNKKTIHDIVTQEPHYLDIIKKKWLAVKNGKVMISVNKPPLSVIGIKESYFDKTVLPQKAATSSKKVKSLEAIKTIILVFILKKNADLIFDNVKEGMSKAEATAAIKKDLKSFLGAEFPDYDFDSLTKQLDIDHINKRAEQAKPQEVTYKAELLDNRTKNMPNPQDKGLKAIRVKDGDALGETYEGHKFVSKNLKATHQQPSEDIRPKWAIKAKKENIEDVFVITKKLSAFLILRTDYGPKLPAIATNNAGRRIKVNVIRKVLSNLTKKDLTPLIIKHEDRHAEDHWKAWKNKVLDALRKRLNEIYDNKEIQAHRFELTEGVQTEEATLTFNPKEESDKVRSKKAIREDTVQGKFKSVVFTAKYYIKRGDKEGTPVQKASDFLTKEFAKDAIMKKYGGAFKTEFKRLADVFHKTKAGQPITGFELEKPKDVSNFLKKNDPSIKDFLKNNPDLKKYIDKLR